MRENSVKAGDSFGTLGLKALRKPSRMPAKSLHPDHVEFFSALGRRIKEMRRERGWSLHDMVVKHGYYQSQWQKYEKGGPVTVDSLLRMATIFGIDLAALIGSLGQFPCRTIDDIAKGEGKARGLQKRVQTQESVLGVVNQL